MEIKEALDNLLVAIRESDDYKTFENAKEVLKSDEEAHRKMDAFRIHSYKANNAPESPDPLSDMRDLMQEKQEISSNPLVDDYLKAEVRLCRMMQHICSEVLQVTDMEIDGFVDQI